MKFRSFRSRILFYFLSLMTLVQLAGFWAFDAAITQSTRNRIAEQLRIGAGAFTRIIEERTEAITLANRVLSSDFAFKKAFFAGLQTEDTETMHWVVKNHQNRINSDVMMLISLDGDIIADAANPERSGLKFEFPHLLEAAEENGSVAETVFLAGHAYQLIVVPLLAPEPAAWICSGFLVDDTLAKDLRDASLAHISFIRLSAENKPEILASTLDAKIQDSLSSALSSSRWKAGESFSMELASEEFISFIVSLGENDNAGLKVLLQRSMKREMASFLRLRTILIAIFAFSVLATALGGVILSGSVTKPVSVLAEGARRIRQGEYDHIVEIRQSDEIGHLADTFNEMTRGLADRDRVRDLLGKVVSPEIAEELLKKGMELGGEEREVTILFSDIRGFTTISEKLPPHDVLNLLNTYLTEMSAVIEKHNGVVDKYIGDAIMALFGAPVRMESHADAAVKAALEMSDALDELNAGFRKQGLPELNIGIGINTAVVVAGNMGSSSRLNYTVIGDGVNVASRLESLTKEKAYNTRIIISQAVIDASSIEINARPLGEVAVKGKRETTKIFAIEKSA